MQASDAMERALHAVFTSDGVDSSLIPTLIVMAICDLTHKLDSEYPEPIRRVTGVQLSRELGKLR